MQSIVILTDKKERVDDFIKKNFSKEDFIIYINPEKNEYSINQIRNIKKEIKYLNNKKRIYVFYEFERSSLESQNALLKILEEPPLNVYFILVCKNIYQIIPTIISRTKVVNLKNQFKEKENEKIYQIIQRIKKGKIFFVDVVDREEAKEMIMSIIYYFKKELNNNLKIYAILKEAIKSFFLLEKNYLNPQLTIDNLIIFINKYYNEIK